MGARKSGHGQIGNSIYNHCNLYAILVKDIDTGYGFYGGHIWSSGGVYIKNSQGIILNNFSLKSYVLTLERGGLGDGLTKMHDCIFHNTPTFTQNVGGTTFLSLKGNDYWNGSSNAAINN